MALAAKVHLVEGQLRRSKPTWNKISKISTQHIKANSFQKGMAKYWINVNIKQQNCAEGRLQALEVRNFK